MNWFSEYLYYVFHFSSLGICSGGKSQHAAVDAILNMLIKASKEQSVWETLFPRGHISWKWWRLSAGILSIKSGAEMWIHSICFLKTSCFIDLIVKDSSMHMFLFYFLTTSFLIKISSLSSLWWRAGLLQSFSPLTLPLPSICLTLPLSVQRLHISIKPTIDAQTEIPTQGHSTLLLFHHDFICWHMDMRIH